MHRYGSDAASSYAAYRPPLHAVILRRALGDRMFGRALDFGCGTGQSAQALVDRCDQIMAVDRSPEMLAAALPDDKITYELGSERQMPAANASIDLVTMAGVVAYLDLHSFQAELRRICRPAALLVPYDFKAILDPLSDLFLDPANMPRNVPAWKRPLWNARD
ncbi:MAG: methyltransferase domain-containing protein [Pseudomonadota bacterium]